MGFRLINLLFLMTNCQTPVFIRLIVIDKDYQRKGFGREAIDLSLSYLKNIVHVGEAYLAVIEENEKARLFWETIGFTIYRKLDKHVTISRKQCNVIIMKRKL